jgi:hypothetical protein
MKKTIACCFLLVLMTNLDAQEYISVPLDNSAYDIIEMGVMRGIITPPPSAKPWSKSIVKKKLWEMMDDPEEVLSSKEAEMLDHAYNSFEREEGLELLFSLESDFAVQAPDASISSVNLAKINARGNFADFMSWDLTVLGEFLYIERESDTQIVPSMFPYTMSKMWDGGVLSLRTADTYFAWPEDPSLAAGLLGELSGVLFDQQLKLRLGRLRRDWGSGTSGSSLFINANGSPFIALDGVVSPRKWLDISFLTGVTEYYQNENQWPGPDDSLFINLLSAVQFEFNPVRYIYFSIGGSAIWLHQVNLAAFANLELRAPGLLKVWGSLFVDRLDSFPDDVTNGNSYAYQAGVKTLVQWLPFGAFTLRYTKVEPYCYTDSYDGYSGRSLPSMTAFVSSGESLGYSIPPNSDELLIRLESMFLPDLKAHIQFQMIRHGAEYGYGRVYGSSLKDRLTDASSTKHFLEDGVYRWNNVIKLGGSFKFMAGNIPLSVYAETGFVSTGFTINGIAGTGNEADYDQFNNSVYRSGNGFIFSFGFRLFSR